ncbi:MAG: glycosyltransferase [Firmicutes bacterium]|nr:glycosyltransferase [Bacillota bacterium]
MTLAQGIYLGLVAVYLVLFVLFLRLFVWKHYAYRTSWSRRPAHLSRSLVEGMTAKAGRDLPRFSIFVPARNEAAVIERTVDHLARLDYPKTHYEIIIATDEKERMAADEDQEAVVADLTEFLTADGQAPQPGSHADVALSALLARLALDEGALPRRYGANLVSLKAARALPPVQQGQVLVRLTQELIRSRGWASSSRLQQHFARGLGNHAQEEVRRLFPVYLSLAMPVVMAHAKLVRDTDERMVSRLISKTARASQPLTQKILQAMTETLSHRILDRLTRLRKQGLLAPALAAAYEAAFPTTLSIVERKIGEWAEEGDKPVLKHAVVPYDFDGLLDGVQVGKPVPSTKGRALNYAIRLADPSSEMLGFYDAESRPDLRVLQYVAYRRLQEGNAVGILQGPVFQVRNFYQMQPITKVAALYQSISHDWVLPSVFKRLPFVGGTNLFVDTALLCQIGGYDQTCLTEDVELGIRAYMEAGVWPEYLPYPSSEQTPTTLAAFYRQRLRWGSGYLQVFDKLRDETKYPEEIKRPLLRTLYLKGQVEWTVYQAAAFLPIVIWLLWSQGLVDPSILPLSLREVMSLASVIYLGFTFYAYYRYSPHVDPAAAPYRWLRQVGALAQLLLLPFSAFFLPVPYSSALLLKAVGRSPRAWVKTPRTQE